MGFLSNIFGTNQKYSTSKLSGDYNRAYKPARDAYNEISGIGRQMMDPDSDFNQNRRSMMEAQGADRAAEAARMGQRMAAMSGGAPAAAMAAQAGATTNKAMADSQSAFNQYLQGAMGQGVGMLSSSANNLSSMAENQMNAVNAQRLANARIDSQASGAMASLAGTALGGIGTALGGPAGGTAAKFLTGLFAQEGGMVPDDEEEYMMYGGKVKYKHGGPVYGKGGMLSQIMGPKGPMKIPTRMGGFKVGQ